MLPPWVRVCAESQGVILACLSNLIRDVKESRNPVQFWSGRGVSAFGGVFPFRNLVFTHSGLPVKPCQTE